MDRKPEPIAIIGSSCRFPGGATSPSKLWDLLQSPEDLLVKIPDERFNTTGFYHADADYHGRTNVTHSYLCNEDYRVFDHAFFSIHRREAESMDPQQRILLEVVYEGIEAAGYTIDGLRGSQTGVFVGQMTDDFNNILYKDVENIPQYAGSGGSRAIMANRVSYFFDWHGPSLNIDTACSSSLVATHQAVQALRNGESGVAIVAGVNLIIGPENYIAESKMHMLSPTGRSRMWDADADGYARGEGFAAIVLKPLSQAIADKDHIECIIRETGVNQDGRTPGLTVPQPASQVALIESTYRKCGLDPRKREDRCQYFEAHGTGTLVGDPKEAEAIRNVFFPPTGECGQIVDSDAEPEVLHVGSVKTVIGHSEGTAGLAALIKASLAVQHAKIPPNMHFNKLNPAVEPFYHPHLRVSTRLLPWPELPPGAPRRASINSFGFGGTNAHAIIENWDPASSSDSEKTTVSSGPWGPFVLSANTHTSLASKVASLSKTLKNSDEVNLADLAWTYQLHRTEFPVKVAFSAPTKEVLVEKLEAAVAKHSSQDGLSQFTSKAIKVSDRFPLRILGVFTGQGSQWPSMGARLFEQCEQFRKSIKILDNSLARLPDAPSWTLAEELMATGDASRVHLAEISQPLTTALQIALVDLLQVSGVSFKAVVGHSSGEIAAAYAAGYLNAGDAIRLAYYRGVHSQLAQSSDGQLGKMMAVGMTFENAIEFCQRSEFVDRITVAASNSKSSVTLAGDADAIMEAKVILDSEKIFARILIVEKAYHSHHMQPCATPYIESLRRCKIEPQRTKVEGECTWYSSVHGPNGRSIHDPHALRDQYWVKNLVNPVLFSQAVERAVREDYCFDLVLEIGPHTALQGPTTETLKTLTGTDIPYHGVLKRGENDITAFEDMLGFVWTNVLSSGSILKWDAFRQACSGRPWHRPRPLKGLPSYSWDHNEPLFRESRQSKQWRMYNRPAHELLGRATYHGNTSEMRWRNIFKLREMEWLTGHQFQHQILFPAAGYVSMAIEAACFMAADQPIRLVELQDLRFLRAITVEDESMDIEVTFVIRVTHRNRQQISAEYTCYSGDADAGRMSPDIEHTNFTGHVTIFLGEPSPDALPPRMAPKLPLTSVDPDEFYRWTEKIGLQYSDGFLVDSIQRRLNQATVVVKRPKNCRLRIHPATLDAAFHGVFAAYSFPGDGRMWAPYLPSSIGRVRVSMASDGFSAACLGCTSSLGTKGDALVADCNIRQESTESIQADVEVFCATRTCHHPEVQIEGLACSSFNVPTVKDDRALFSRMVWKRDITCGLAEEDWPQPLAVHDQLSEVYERTAYYYLRKLCDQVSNDSVSSMEWHFQCLMDWALNHVLPTIEAGQHPRVKAEWADDTYEMLMEWKERYPKHVELEILHALGEHLPTIVLGSIPALDILMEEDRLYRLYKEGLGFPQANEALASLAGQFSHQYPRMRILEIGAGTGSASSAVLEKLGGNFESYTYTDLSPSFFEKAQVMFAQYTDKMHYQVLDIERCPLEQGYEEGGFDLVIASNVLHATRSLKNTLSNCRKLMRPGGRLMLLEITNDMLYGEFIFAGLPGWWLGRDDGRVYSPAVSESRWSALLRKSGFSGVDHVTRDHQKSENFYFSVMISQAVNSQVDLLREPLRAPSNGMPVIVDNLVILGGNTLQVNNLALQMQSLLSPLAQQITLIDNWDAVNDEPGLIKPGSAVVCLGELEDAVFSRPRTVKRLKTIQSIFHDARHVLWVTRGRRADKPLANMMVGIGRSVMMETPHLRMLFVDIESHEDHQPKPTMFSEMLLRMIYLDREEYQGILWNAETELVVDKDNNIYIPRVCTDDLANRRLNSERRAIEKTVDLNSAPLAIMRMNDALTLEEVFDQNSPLSQVSHGKQVQVRAHYSSVFAFSAGDGPPVYLCEGSTLEPMPHMVLALSPVNASRFELPVDQTFVLKRDEARPGQNLQHVLMVLLCKSLLAGLSGTLWLHDANADLVEMIYELRKSIGVDVFFSTSDITCAGKETTFIHPQISQRSLEYLVPRSVQRFIYAGTDENWTLDATLRFCRSNMIDIRYLSQKANKDIIIPLGLNSSILYEIISESAKFETLSHQTQANIVEVDHVSSLSSLQDPASIIDWTNTEAVRVRIRPLSLQKMFSSQKTYFLVGMAGEVGMSLIEWMALHGGRHFAVASRNPRIDPEVMLHLQRKGANIKVYPFDIADKNALLKAHRDIVASMPPIGGVANGALVLRDRAFSNMVLDDLETVLQPKVQGTINLNELFYTDNLDFFILFSSLSSIIGNAGQSNYGAANMFMSSLATQRRRRGLAASVIHLAPLLGLGYLSLMSHNTLIKNQLNKFSMLALSEPDLHVIFAEAIASGWPDSGIEPDLITGLRDDGVASWRRLPIFSHHLLNGNEKTTAKGHDQDGQAQLHGVRSQLAKAASHQEALEILEGLFSTKLGVVLQTSAENIDRTASLMTLGIDSLVAVEARSWFLKEMAVDIPILKMLGGASVTDICRAAVAKMPDLSFNNKPANQRGADMPTIEPVSSGQSLASSRSGSITNLGDDSGSAASTSDTIPSDLEVTPASPTKIAYERIGGMSKAQSRLFFLHEYLDDKSTFNVGYVGKFTGPIDLSRLKRALYDVCRQHESLRSSYFIDKDTGRPVQAVNSEPLFDFVEKQIGNTSEFRAEVDAQRKFTFSIERGQVLKVTVLSLSPSVHHIIFLHHHIALDGMGWLLFVRSLQQTLSGERLEWPVQQCIDMSSKEHETSSPADLCDELAYWGELHKDPHEPLPVFPFAKVKNRQVLKSYDTETVTMELDPDLAHRARQQAAALSVTPFHFYLAAFAVFLNRCLDVQDFSIGIVDANRRDPEDYQTVGYFLNLLPLRFRVGQHTQEKFEQIVKQSRDMVLSALANSRAPFDAILTRLRVSRSGSHHPLFQAMLNYRQGYTAHTPLGDGSIEWDADSITARYPYDLSVDITQVGARTALHWTAQKYMYDANDSKLMMKWYMRIVESLCSNPAATVSKCLIANDNDLRHVFRLGEARSMVIDWAPGTIVHRIEKMAADYPDSTAIVCDSGNRLTYAQMLARSMQISRHLLRIFGSSAPISGHVGMLLDPQADHVCSFLAIMRLGLVCIPLDLRNPDERLAAMVSDCRPQVIVCNGATKARAQQLATQTTVQLLDLDEDRSSNPVEEVANNSQLSHPAVILYTSGSTGVPKGVLISHSNILNHIFVNTSLYSIGREVVLQQSSLGFDLSLDQTFHALANGGTLVIVSQEGRGDPAHIAQLILEERVTYTLFCPSEYLSLLNYGFHTLKKCPNWKFAFSLGEKLTLPVRKAFQKLGMDSLTLINAYGPTEATIACARGVVPYRTDQDVTTQRDFLWPMPNHSLLVVDEQLNPQPVGFPGEICIGGMGVTLGYLNRQEENKKQFVEIDTASLSEGKQVITRVYRTGDQGRLLADGSLEVLGRLSGDSQVKIRGNRVELDEISNVLVKKANTHCNNAVVSAAVSYRPDPDILLAFVVFDSEFTGDRAAFADRLRNNLPLPAHMCPAHVVPVDRIPMTVNGKQDRAAIDKLIIPAEIYHKKDEEMDATVTSNDINDAEQQMKEVWLEVLDHIDHPSEITTRSDFFQVGGNSMMAIKLRSVIQTTFGVTIRLPELFRFSTLGDMTAHVCTSQQENNGLAIDWSAEIAALYHGLPQSLNTPILASKSSSSSNLNIVLTGATGFLGTHILNCLISDPLVAKVHCIAIRPASDGRLRVSIKSPKIIEYAGDLSDPSLGLSDAQFRTLSDTADLIIHNGARVSYLQSYTSLRSTNVISTRTLAAIALPRRVPIHFVSSAAVAGVSWERSFSPLPEVSISDLPPAPDALDGYGVSKWVAESLLERVSSNHSLPVCVHRPAIIIGDGAPGLDLMAAIINFSHVIGAVPKVEETFEIQGSFDLVPVKEVAKQIAEVALRGAKIEQREGTMRFMHHCNETKVVPERLREYMEEAYGRPCGEIPMVEWLSLAQEKGLSEVLYTFLKDAAQGERTLMLAEITK